MDLSSEDTLRLNVLLANKPLAIRVQESTLSVFGLSDKGEVRISLNPNCRDDQYIRRVREMLSGHVLGSPGGYPVYLRRWTRMGQMRDDSLEKLLLLGEPEAVVAVVCAPGLTDEIARRAWWAMEDAENARRMLQREPVVQGRMGPILAHYLVEHLPFESEPETMIETVRLVLQPGLIDAEMRDDLWKRAGRRNAYYVGFLAALPDDLPLALPAHPLAEDCGRLLAEQAGTGNGAAALLQRLFSSPGQAFLETLLLVLKKPSNQEVVTITLDVIADYCAAVRPEGRADETLEGLSADAEAFLATPPAQALLREHEALRPYLRAARLLSGMGYGVIRPVLRDTSAIGSLMRRKLEPVMTPLRAELSLLRGPQLVSEKIRK